MPDSSPTATATVFNATSARKYKKNITTINNGLELLGKLTPVRFDWLNKNTKQDIGFIADDVNDVLPTLVHRNSKNEIEGLDYDKISVVLAAALKESVAKVEKLEARLNILENK